MNLLFIMKLAPRGYLTISHAIHKLAPMSPVSTFDWRIKSHRKWQTHMHVSSPKFPRFPPNRFSLFPGALALACGQLLVSKQAWNCTKAVTNSKPKGAYTKKKGKKNRTSGGTKGNQTCGLRICSAFPLLTTNPFSFFRAFPHLLQVGSRKVCNEFHVA